MVCPLLWFVVSVLAFGFVPDVVVFEVKAHALCTRKCATTDLTPVRRRPATQSLVHEVRFSMSLLILSDKSLLS